MFLVSISTNLISLCVLVMLRKNNLFQFIIHMSKKYLAFFIVSILHFNFYHKGFNGAYLYIYI